MSRALTLCLLVGAAAPVTAQDTDPTPLDPFAVEGPDDADWTREDGAPLEGEVPPVDPFPVDDGDDVDWEYEEPRADHPTDAPPADAPPAEPPRPSWAGQGSGDWADAFAQCSPSPPSPLRCAGMCMW